MPRADPDRLAEVQNAARRAAELTRQLLVFLRRDLVQPSVLDVNGSIADAIATRGVLEPGISVVEKPFTSAELLRKVRELLPPPAQAAPDLVTTGISDRPGVAGRPFFGRAHTPALTLS